MLWCSLWETTELLGTNTFCHVAGVLYGFTNTELVGAKSKSYLLCDIGKLWGEEVESIKGEEIIYTVFQH